MADNGGGIAPEHLPRIFERFYTTKSSGLGLGLPISRSIIESHGGSLWCDSSPSESTVFRFTLPASAYTSPERAVNVGGRSPLSRACFWSADSCTEKRASLSTRPIQSLIGRFEGGIGLSR